MRRRDLWFLAGLLGLASTGFGQLLTWSSGTGTTGSYLGKWEWDKDTSAFTREPSDTLTTFDITFGDFIYKPGEPGELISFTATQSGLTSFVLQSAAVKGGNGFNYFDYDAGGIAKLTSPIPHAVSHVTFYGTVIPEPGTYALTIGAAAIGYALVHRRKRRRRIAAL